MIAGIALSGLPRKTLSGSVRRFKGLRRDFPLEAVEISLEDPLFAPALRPNAGETLSLVSELRKSCRILGVHLPHFAPAGQPGSAPASRLPDPLRRALGFAAETRADYVVLHAENAGPVSTKQTGPPIWRTPDLSGLQILAAQAGVRLCLKNAGALARLKHLRALLDRFPDSGCCLSVGHLFEREYPADGFRQAVIRLNDRFLSRPFRLRAGLPVAGLSHWTGALRLFADRLTCLHLHNHNGRSAGQPLNRGRIDLRRLRHWAGLLRETPVILVADYRLADESQVRRDLEFMTFWLS